MTTIDYAPNDAHSIVHHEPYCVSQVRNGQGQTVSVVGTCGGVWQCCMCGRLFGYCHGAHLSDDTDEENEACDDCWSLMKATVPE